MFPHCLLIVSHLELFVKRFFWNSLAIPDIFLGGQLLVSWLHHQGLAFVPLLYHTLSGLSRGFFNFFYSFGRWLRRNWLKRWASFHTVTHGGHQFPTSLVTHGFPLDTLIVSQLGRFVKGFLHFFSASRLHHHACASGGFSVDYLPLTLQIIPHLPPDCNRQNTQNREK